MKPAPPIAIGMPVYNGESFLAETLAALLRQTEANFELIITDNASEDATEEICRDFSRQDTRIRYERFGLNLGAAANYTRCFDLARSQYFKWAAHDDLCAPQLLERCREVLDDDAGCVVAHSRVQSIDSSGAILKTWPARPKLGHDDALVRVDDVLHRRDTFPIWGLMRRDVLAATGLLGSYAEHDRPLLFELAIAGRFSEIDEFLFFDREHPGRSVRAYDPRDPHTAVAWYDTKLGGKLVFPAWRLLGEYVAALHRSSVRPVESLPYLEALWRWTGRHRTELVRDLGVAAERMPAVGGAATELRRRVERRRWDAWVRRFTRELGRVVPAGSQIALLDEQMIGRERLGSWTLRDFPDSGAVWEGPPASDGEACLALEQQAAVGTQYLVVAEPSFWWFDHYPEFGRRVERDHTLVGSTARLKVFDLEQTTSNSGGGG